MRVAFSFTNRLRLGQAKGGLGFKSLRHCEPFFGEAIIQLSTGDCFVAKNKIAPRNDDYDNAHVGWTSIPISET